MVHFVIPCKSLVGELSTKRVKGRGKKKGRGGDIVVDKDGRLLRVFYSMYQSSARLSLLSFVLSVLCTRFHAVKIHFWL